MPRARPLTTTTPLATRSRASFLARATPAPLASRKLNPELPPHPQTRTPSPNAHHVRQNGPGWAKPGWGNGGWRLENKPPCGPQEAATTPCQILPGGISLDPMLFHQLNRSLQIAIRLRPGSATNFPAFPVTSLPRPTLPDSPLRPAMSTSLPSPAPLLHGHTGRCHFPRKPLAIHVPGPLIARRKLDAVTCRINPLPSRQPDHLSKLIVFARIQVALGERA